MEHTIEFKKKKKEWGNALHTNMEISPRYCVTWKNQNKKNPPPQKKTEVYNMLAFIRKGKNKNLYS